MTTNEGEAEGEKPSPSAGTGLPPPLDGPPPLADDHPRLESPHDFVRRRMAERRQRGRGRPAPDDGAAG